MATIAEMTELARQLGAAQQHVAALTPVAPATASDKKLKSIIDTRIVNRVGTFDGDDASWKQWCFVFESAAGLVDLDNVLTVVEQAADETGLEYCIQTSEVQLRMCALYHLLVSVTRGRALTIMQMVPRNNGAIGWRRLKLEYEPRSGGRLTAMLIGILKPEWDEAALKGADAWETAWKTWEKNLSLYEEQSGELLGPATKIAILTRWAPSDVKSVISER